MIERSLATTLALVLTGSAALGCGGSSAAAGATTPETEPRSSANDGTARTGLEARIARGAALLDERRCEEAIRLAFDPAIAELERSFDPGTRLIGSRTAAAPPASATTASDGRRAVLIDAQYSDTIYLRAYCLMLLDRVPEAAQALRRALEIIPDDIVYACEYASILQQRREWAPSLDVYRRALANADVLERSGVFRATAEHPAGLPILGRTLSDWRRHAMRGIAFTLLEVGDLDGAEAMLHRVLELDPSDGGALYLLEFLPELRRETH